ncbi:MAG: CAF17-like 4Fe-4S cluster assembly/insertion protein YgfZ [Acidimicrobiales bacterium]
MADLDLRSTLGAAPLRRDVVLVHGPEAATYLQGQLSQDVDALAEGASAPALLLQPTGKVDAWLRVSRASEEAFALDVDAGWGEAVATRLRRFKLRTQTEVDVATWSGFAVRGPGADSLELLDTLPLPARWPGVEGVDLLAPGGGAELPDTVPLTSVGALEALRIECGVPAMGAELTEATIPAEAGQWLIDTSVSFTKGCYTGQELVARIDSRGGNVPRPIRGLRVEGPVPPVGAEVFTEGDEERDAVGRVTSSAHSASFGSVALVSVARSAAVGQAVEVRWDGGAAKATLVELPLR